MILGRAVPLASLIAIAAAAAGDSITGVSWGPQRLDVFGADSKADIFHKYYTAFGWGPDDPAHGNLELYSNANASSPVSVTSWGTNRLDFVFVDANSSVLHKYWDGSSWQPGGMEGYESFGKGYVGKVAINSWGPERFDLVAFSIDRVYRHKAWTGKGYYPPGDLWEDLGGHFASEPATVSWGHDRLDVFGIDTKGHVQHKWWDGREWLPPGQGWENLGGLDFVGVPVASSMDHGRYDVWAVSERNGELYHLFWDGHQLHEWQSIGGNFTTAPQVVHWAPGRIDILGKSANDSSYQYKYWDGHQWNGWLNKGGGPYHSEPALVTISENNLNLLGVDKEGKLKLQVWDGSQWLPGADAWYELGNTKVAGGSEEDVESERAVFHDVEREQRKVELRFRS